MLHYVLSRMICRGTGMFLSLVRTVSIISEWSCVFIAASQGSIRRVGMAFAGIIPFMAIMLYIVCVISHVEDNFSHRSKLVDGSPHLLEFCEGSLPPVAKSPSRTYGGEGACRVPELGRTLETRSLSTNEIFCTHGQHMSTSF
jgi:hypothetical protein